jgi:sigma-B regulation protein RsbU (phosphoserine phosphatase)
MCEHLKADDKLMGIPIIFISALTDQLDKVKAFATGGVDYITKPFQMEELHARVETHLKLRHLQIELQEANAQLSKVNGRMSRDLEVAAKIQETFLPRKGLRVPGVDFAWIYQPCDELAGDGLCIIPLSDGKFGLYVLDVSGHGVASALLSVTLSRLLSPPSEPSSILIRDGDQDRLDIAPPTEVAARLNRLFPFDPAIEQLTTMIYGILNAATGEFRYVSAGHPGPVHLPYRADPVILESEGFPIGLADEVYEERSVCLGAGDRLYLYSDGVPEAMNPAGDQFGEARLLEAIAQGRSEPLQENVATLLGEITRWHGTERPHDDISILAVEVSVATGSGDPKRLN